MRVGIDTNILVYAEGANGAGMQERTLEFLARLSTASVVLPVQVLGELFSVLVKKGKQKPATARQAVLNWRDAYSLADTSLEVLLQAADLASDHGLSIWDAVVISAAAEAGCRLLLSEDLQDGFTWRGITVTNPFARTPHPLLTALLPSEDAS
jgi:predicted nucleic acid-binding protein